MPLDHESDLHLSKLYVIGNTICPQYTITQNLNEWKLKKGDRLNFIRTQNYKKKSNSWEIIFENINVKEGEEKAKYVTLLSTVLEKGYLKCSIDRFKPHITNHISILGNDITYNEHYKTVAHDELSITLTVILIFFFHLFFENCSQVYHIYF